jgi:hypothetical protein
MKTMIYIMSPSYSGSTLLTFLLANHPSISTIGELKASALGDVNEYDCSCGKKILECGFWAEVAREMRARGNRFSLDRFGTHFRSENYQIDRILRATVRGGLFEEIRRLAIAFVPGCKAERDRILHQNNELIDVVCGIQGGGCYLDGSKDPVRLKHFYESGLWDIRVIFLVRDGRGVANSYMNHVGVNMEFAANEWLHKCKEMDRLRRLIPKSKLLFLKYEDLCRETDEMLNALLVFAGLDADQFQADFGKNTHHILGNAMRLRSSGEIKLDEKWRKMLSEDDLAIFNSIGGAMNSSLGYH